MVLGKLQGSEPIPPTPEPNGTPICCDFLALAEHNYLESNDCYINLQTDFSMIKVNGCKEITTQVQFSFETALHSVTYVYNVHSNPSSAF